MDELELRIAGAETAIIALAAWRDPRAVLKALAILREQMMAATGEERTILQQAIQLIEDGRGHHHPFTGGMRITPP